MKFYYAILFVFTLGLSGCQTHTPNQKELAASINKFNKAFAHGDLEVLDALTTKNYLHTNSSSQVIGKSDWFKYLKKRNERLRSGEFVVLDYVLDQTKIEYHGNSAIVTGRVTVATKDSTGTIQNQYRITNLWVFEEGRWKRAGFHDGKID